MTLTVRRYKKGHFLRMLDDSLKICILSKADAFGGGAGKCADDLATLLNQAGHYAKHFCYWAGKGFNATRSPLINRFFRPIFYFREGFEKKILGLPELTPFELPYLLKHGILDYDIIHVHDICSAISPLTVYYLAKRKKVVWTFHDCSPFTGGCLYPMACEKFKTKCLNCPQKEWPINSHFAKTNLMQKIKRKILTETDITIVSPSKWMADTAYMSSALDRRPKIIRNGVDTLLFKPIHKAKARNSLSIPTQRYVILVSAALLTDKRKGFTYAIQAIKQIKDMKPFLMLLGDCPSNLDKQLEGVDFRKFGYQSEPQAINTIYAAADVFLFPSLADNQPLSILESFASGTPVVSFATGGIPEMIKNNAGAVVKPKDVNALSQALRRFKNSSGSNGYAHFARHRAENGYPINRYLDNHLKLYNEIARNNRNDLFI